MERCERVARAPTCSQSHFRVHLPVPFLIPPHLPAGAEGLYPQSTGTPSHRRRKCVPERERSKTAREPSRQCGRGRGRDGGATKVHRNQSSGAGPRGSNGEIRPGRGGHPDRQGLRLQHRERPGWDHGCGDDHWLSGALARSGFDVVLETGTVQGEQAGSANVCFNCHLPSVDCLLPRLKKMRYGFTCIMIGEFQPGRDK